jgi:hypothetical protein
MGCPSGPGLACSSAKLSWAPPDLTVLPNGWTEGLEHALRVADMEPWDHPTFIISAPPPTQLLFGLACMYFSIKKTKREHCWCECLQYLSQGGCARSVSG